MIWKVHILTNFFFESGMAIKRLWVQNKRSQTSFEEKWYIWKSFELSREFNFLKDFQLCCTGGSTSANLSNLAKSQILKNGSKSISLKMGMKNKINNFSFWIDPQYTTSANFAVNCCWSHGLLWVTWHSNIQFFVDLLETFVDKQFVHEDLNNQLKFFRSLKITCSYECDCDIPNPISFLPGCVDPWVDRNFYIFPFWMDINPNQFFNRITPKVMNIVDLTLLQNLIEGYPWTKEKKSLWSLSLRFRGCLNF